MSFIDLLLSPYNTHKKKKALQKEYRKRDSLDTKILEQEQIITMIERDFDLIAQDYLDNNKYQDITISCNEQYQEFLISCITRQGFDFVVLSETTVLVRN